MGRRPPVDEAEDSSIVRWKTWTRKGKHRLGNQQELQVHKDVQELQGTGRNRLLRDEWIEVDFPWNGGIRMQEIHQLQNLHT